MISLYKEISYNGRYSLGVRHLHPFKCYPYDNIPYNARFLICKMAASQPPLRTVVRKSTCHMLEECLQPNTDNKLLHASAILGSNVTKGKKVVSLLPQNHICEAKTLNGIQLEPAIIIKLSILLTDHATILKIDSIITVALIEI